MSELSLFTKQLGFNKTGTIQMGGQIDAQMRKHLKKTNQN